MQRVNENSQSNEVLAQFGGLSDPEQEHVCEGVEGQNRGIENSVLSFTRQKYAFFPLWKKS